MFSGHTLLPKGTKIGEWNYFYCYCAEYRQLDRDEMDGTRGRLSTNGRYSNHWFESDRGFLRLGWVDRPRTDGKQYIEIDIDPD